MLGSIGRVRVEDVANLWQVRARAADQRDKPMMSYGLPLHDVPFELRERRGSPSSTGSSRRRSATCWRARAGRRAAARMA
ncbi:MAG: hypothetical protein M5U09_18330 [Gammaproteobacteria bacterium]|nr:hypothetical protein [Gammaproteobacteria bacterium]